ncbi:MAG: Trm112 family protein [Thermoguttaceae bacterium]|jgi:uncharacterized protein YbaR (Trm112 family)|nr:Trm112 family protein [Thermoguttaceae bacterium]
MMDPEVQKLLVCPESRTRLDTAGAELIDRVNRAIAAGRVRNRVGQEVAQPIQDGLVREDGAVLYPVVDGIPALLVDEAIPLDQLEA